MFSNKIVTFVAIYLSKKVRRLVEPSGYIDCEKCLALKAYFVQNNTTVILPSTLDELRASCHGGRRRPIFSAKLEACKQ